MIPSSKPPTHPAGRLARQILEKQPIYLDTETTGLGPGAEIVEIAVLESDGSPWFQSLVRPTQPIPPDAMRIHGISDEMVRSAPPWIIVWQNLRPLLNNRLVAIYNAEFDLRIMRQSHSRYRQPWRERIAHHCIMKLYAEFRGESNRQRGTFRLHSLGDAGRQLGIPLPNSHRAAGDALLARAVLHAIAGMDFGQNATDQNKIT